ncbi:hypothetical protein B0H14DRAFT_3159195 [Mycena olivaceomarginata]|nr:hypothetical protein B0H14DRAFT_3159195 [Mycena olivaceomarginata]
MSSTSSPFSSTSPTSPPSTHSASSDQLKDPQSNLYIFTFIATLSLLLAVSCAIICRACYRRRRFRRSVRHAMDQGMVLAPPDQGIKFVSPPKLYDVWLTDKYPSPSWAAITPISVQPVPDGELYLNWSNESKTSLSTIRSKSSASSTSSTETLQVSVLVAMPRPPAAPVTAEDEDYLPEVVLGFAQTHQPS